MSEFLSGSLWALVLTAGAYQLGLYLNKKTGSALLHPILVATAVMLYKHKDNYRRILKGEEIGMRSAFKGKHRVK